VPILGLTWPWKTKKGRTVERYDKLGRLRVLCANSGSPATGEIKVIGMTEAVRDSFYPSHRGRPMPPGVRRSLCPECGRFISITGPKSNPRLYKHNAVNRR
jgi:hypothetical protein